ncbi:MAG: multidrug effflux MFS transporter [Pseudomonadota bacterium]
MAAPASVAAPITVIAVLMVFTMSTDLYLPTFPELTGALSTTPSIVQLTLTLNLVAYALATLVHGLLADRFGRQRVLSAGLMTFLAASLVCMSAPTISWLLAGRVGQGLAASTGTVLTALILRELFDDERAQRWLSVMAIAVGFGPAVAPLVGAVVAQNFGWRANFGLLATLAGIGFLAVLRFVPETRPRGQAVPAAGTVVRRYTTVFKNGLFQRYQLLNALSLAALFAFVTAAPFVFIGTFGLSPTRYAMLHGALVMLYIVAAIANGVLAGRVEPIRMIRLALVMGSVGIGTLIVGAVLFDPSLVTVLLGMAFCAVAMGLLMANAWLLLLNSVAPNERATASALSSFSQMLIAALASLAVAMLPAGSLWAMSLVVSLCLAGCLCAYAFLGRGSSLRTSPRS